MASRIGEMIIDCPDPELAAAFWCAALGYRVTDRDDSGVAIAGASNAPTILLIRNDDPKRGKTPIHFDLCPTDREQPAEVERLLALGATRVDVGQRDARWVVLADPAGHEFCVMRTVLPPEPAPFHHLGEDLAHRRPDVSCVFVCRDDDGRILLARRSAGARDEPGAWDCGAGALEFGETFEEAVNREVREEYAVEPRAIVQLGVRNVRRADPPSHWVAVVFEVRVDPAAVAIGEPHKFDRLGWFAPDALPSPLHSQLPATLRLLPPG